MIIAFQIQSFFIALDQMNICFEPKRMKIYNFVAFSVHKINFSHVLPNYKKVRMVTSQFSLTFRKGVPLQNTTKYSEYRKMAIL